MSLHTIASAILDSQQTWARKPADFYPTPYDATQVIVDFLKLGRGNTVWEPAAGDGDMAAVLEANGMSVSSTDLRPTRFVEGGFNFLACGGFDPEPEWIITNPPFKVASAFIEHALAMVPNVAMLLKSQFWHARSRIELFERHPPAYICPLTWRPSFLEKERGSSPLMDVMWVVWRGEVNVTEFVPLRRPTAARMAPIKEFCEDRLGRSLNALYGDILGGPSKQGDFDDILG